MGKTSSELRLDTWTVSSNKYTACSLQKAEAFAEVVNVVDNSLLV